MSERLRLFLTLEIVFQSPIFSQKSKILSIGSSIWASDGIYWSKKSDQVNCFHDVLEWRWAFYRSVHKWRHHLFWERVKNWRELILVKRGATPRRTFQKILKITSDKKKTWPSQYIAMYCDMWMVRFFLIRRYIQSLSIRNSLIRNDPLDSSIVRNNDPLNFQT